MQNSNSNHKRNPHVILVAHPLQGHLIPTVQLALKLASKGLSLTFINAENIHHKITLSKPSAIDHDIFAEARKSSGLDIEYMTVSDGLPLEFDRSLNHDQWVGATLYCFPAHVEVAVAKVVRVKPFTCCLIADSYSIWASKLAMKYGLLYASFWTEAALVLDFYFHIHLLKEHGHIGPESKTAAAKKREGTNEQAIFSNFWKMSDNKEKKGSGKRGATAMRKVIAQRKDGKKIPLVLDLNGIPVGRSHTTMISWIGRSMKEFWPCYASQKIEEKDLQVLLKEVLSPFVYPEGELNTSYVVKKMTNSHKDWRYNLRVEYKKGVTFEEIKKKWPNIEEDEWREFVARTEDPSFKEKSDKAKLSRQANQYAVHNLSKKGYDGLLKEVEDETYEQMKKDAEDRGLPPPDRSVVPTPGRETLWRLARAKKDGTYLSQEAREIGDKIEHFSQQQSQGLFVPEGRKDVLTMALGKDEHPGRVRGASARHHWSSYFGRAPYPHGREKCANLAKEAAQEAAVQAVATIGATWRDYVAKHGANADSTAWLNHIFGVPSDQTTPAPDPTPIATPSLGDDDADPTPARKAPKHSSKAVPSRSTRRPPSKAVPTPPSARRPSSKAHPTTSASTSGRAQGANLASLCITRHGKREVVAYGKVTQNKKVHGKTLTDDQVSVMVVDVAPGAGYAPLPYDTEDAMIVSQAKGSFVIWDRCDVDFVETTTQESTLNFLGRLNALKDAYFRNGEVQELTIPAASIGIDVVDSFALEDVTDMNSPTSLLTGQWMNIALNELHILCETRGHRHISFCTPSYTHDGISSTHASRYIRDWLRAEGNVLLCPISMPMDKHWVLVVIFNATGHAYIFDSANIHLVNKLPDRVQDHFQIGYEKFAGEEVDLKWFPAPSPQQLDGWRCGYVVFSIMLALIMRNPTPLTEEEIVQFVGTLTLVDASEVQQLKQLMAQGMLRLLQQL